MPSMFFLKDAVESDRERHNGINGYPFQDVNRSLSVRTLKKNLLKAFNKPFKRFAYPLEQF